MAENQRDVKNRIGSVKNIQKITSAMEMVAAARLRRAEQRISALRPYAEALTRMTQQAALAAGSEASRLPLLNRREDERRVAVVLVTADRGLAGAFNSQIVRAGVRAANTYQSEGRELHWYASGRRGVSSLNFRGWDIDGAYTGYTDRPSFADARKIAGDLMVAYADDEIDRVEIVYNGYVSPLTQIVRHETLLPLVPSAILGSEEDGKSAGRGASVEYEPDPEKILRALVPDYIEISIYRALLESSASEHGARMTAMRSASENAGDIITELTLKMNRVRQAEITQEIMEVVAGAEGVA